MQDYKKQQQLEAAQWMALNGHLIPSESVSSDDALKANTVSLYSYQFESEDFSDDSDVVEQQFESKLVANEMIDGIDKLYADKFESSAFEDDEDLEADMLALLRYKSALNVDASEAAVFATNYNLKQNESKRYKALSKPSGIKLRRRHKSLKCRCQGCDEMRAIERQGKPAPDKFSEVKDLPFTAPVEKTLFDISCSIRNDPLTADEDALALQAIKAVKTNADLDDIREDAFQEIAKAFDVSRGDVIKAINRKAVIPKKLADLTPAIFDAADFI